jgi:hypothetical protein
MDVKIDWDDCSVCFRCPVCNSQLIADGDEEQTCDCGKITYRLDWQLKVEKIP